MVVDGLLCKWCSKMMSWYVCFTDVNSLLRHTCIYVLRLLCQVYNGFVHKFKMLTESESWLFRCVVDTMWQRWHTLPHRGFVSIIIIITLQMWIFQDDCILSGLVGCLEQSYAFVNYHSRSLYPNQTRSFNAKLNDNTHVCVYIFII